MSSDQLNALPRGYEIHGYQFESVLGSGGFGITYRALETSLGRTVAIKEYLPAGVAMRGRDLPRAKADAPAQARHSRGLRRPDRPGRGRSALS